DLLGNWPRIWQDVHHKRHRQRHGPLKERAVATKRPCQGPEVAQPATRPPRKFTLEIDTDWKPRRHIMTDSGAVLAVHEDHWRKRDLAVQSLAFLYALPPERCETHQIERAIA